MTWTPEAEARMEERIRRLAGRRRTAARLELRDHVAESASGLAGGGTVLPAHVDEAFARLGRDEEVRATFFPVRQAQRLPRLSVGLLLAATALAAAAVLLEDAPNASCSVTGTGSCTASSWNLDLLLVPLPPLVTLALLALAPRPAAWSAAGAYLLFAVVRLVGTWSGGDARGPSLLLLLAGFATLLAAARPMRGGAADA